MKERIGLQRKKVATPVISNPSLVSSAQQPKDGVSSGTAFSSSHDLSRILPRYQAKLSISQPGDAYEREADSIAQKVMGMGDRSIQQQATPQEDEQLQLKPVGELITPLVQREEILEEEEELQAKSDGNLAIQREAMPEEEEEELQMKPDGNFAVQREEVLEEEEEEIQAKSAVQRDGDGSLATGSDISDKLHSRQGGGSPLSDDVRSFMEPRFGVDFSNIKVHTDGEAVQMARDVGAQAFAYGSDVYFGAGKSPGNNELTAHELTHVVQQTGRMQRKCADCDEEQDLMRKEDMVTHSSLTKVSSIQRQAAPPNANVSIPASDPNRSLTWADFKGRPTSGSFAAETSYKFVRKTIQGTVQFQAKFLFDKSWVLPKYKTPSNHSVNGCTKIVSDCEKYLKQNQNATYGYDGQADSQCQNAIVPSAVQVSSKGDCKSVLGAACDAAMKRDSEERLLDHERTHFDIATALAARANEKIKGGAVAKDVEKELNKESTELQKKYDSETKHGCIASFQAAWDAGIY